MICPVCQVPLQMAERQGVEIDFCPQCRGVWLDRGELDKIIERAAQPYTPPNPAAPSRPTAPNAPNLRERYSHVDPRQRPKRENKSFLDELFDFF